MDADRAAALAPTLQRELCDLLADGPTDVFVHLGRNYLPALGEGLPSLWHISYAQGGIGERLGQLRRWLYAPRRQEERNA